MVRSDVTALILAGGRATRLGGVDKHALVVDGVSIFDRQCNVLLSRVADIIVSAQATIPGPGVNPGLLGSSPGHRTVVDRIVGAGPLAGIAAGAAEARTPWLLVLAGDMPYISAALIDSLLALATDAVEAVGIRIGGRPEPLVCALRVAAVRPHLERRLASSQLKASALLTDDGLRVAWIEEADLRQIDPELRALFNVNSPEDLT